MKLPLEATPLIESCPFCNGTEWRTYFIGRRLPVARPVHENVRIDRRVSDPAMPYVVECVGCGASLECMVARWPCHPQACPTCGRKHYGYQTICMSCRDAECGEARLLCASNLKGRYP